MAHSSGQENTSPMARLLTRALIAVPITMIAAIAILVLVDRRFDAFEDSLQYRFPDPNETESTVAEADSLTMHPVEGQIVYVPAYSHIYHRDGRSLLLTITLSIRNTSMDQEIVVRSVRYFDTKGQEVRSYLTKALRLPPLATTEFLIERDDKSGGSGASFLVDWVADQPVTEPIIEAVMIDTHGQQGISFARSGTVVREIVPQSDSPEDSQ